MSWLDAYFIGLTTIQSNGVPLPQVPIINLTTNLTATPDLANNRINVSATGGGGGGGSVIPRNPAVGTFTMTAGTISDVDVSGAPVVLNLPSAVEGTWFSFFFKNGNLATHKCTLTAPGGKTVQHVNGPPSTSNPSGTTLQDAYTNTLVFDSAGFDQNAFTYIVDANGNYDAH